MAIKIRLRPAASIKVRANVKLPTNIVDALTGDVVNTFNGREGTVLPATGDYTAANITNVAAGTISSTNVQSALNELDGDITSINTLADITRNGIELATIPTGIDFIRTSGYASVGDGGHGLYERVSSEPSHPGKVASVGGIWWELIAEVVNPYQFGATGDGTTDDRTACQSCVDFLEARGTGGVMEIPCGTFKLVGVASDDAHPHGIIVDFYEDIETGDGAGFETGRAIHIIGTGGKLVCATTDMVAVRLCQPGSSVQRLKIDGGLNFWDGTITGTIGVGIIPADIDQTTDVVSQSYCQVIGCTIENCAEGVWAFPGPTVSMSESGCFYLVIRENQFNQNTRAGLFEEAPNGSGNRCTRGNIAFNRVTRGVVGFDLSYTTDFNLIGNNYELISNAYNNGTPLYASYPAIRVGASSEYNKIYGDWAEACTVFIDNDATSTRGILIDRFPLSGTNTGISNLPKFGWDRVLLGPETGSNGPLSYGGFVDGGPAVVIGTSGSDRDVGIYTGSTGVLRQRWEVTGGTTIIGSSSNITIGATGLTFGYTGTMVFSGGPLTVPSIVVDSSSAPTNGMFLPAAATLGWSVGSSDELRLTTTYLAPASDGGLNLGHASGTFTTLYLATSIDFASDIFISRTGSGALGFTGAENGYSFDDDILLAGGTKLNWNSGDVTVTHSANTLAFAGGSYTFDGTVSPASSDGAALGSTSLMWSDGFWALGAVQNYNNGNVTVTHAANSMAWDGTSITPMTLNATGLGVGVSPGRRFQVQGSITEDFVARIENTHATNPYGLDIYVSGVTANTGAYALQVQDAASARFRVRNDGNVTNTNNSYGAISARDAKKNIVPAAERTICVLNTVPVEFNYKTDPDGTPPRLGVISDDEKARWPELVSEDGSFNYMGLVIPLLQEVQRLHARIEQLELR